MVNTCATILGTSAKSVFGKNVTICALAAGGIAGGTYAEARSIRIVRSFRVLEAEVAGTFYPTLGTGVFHGECQLEALYTTDNDFQTLTTPLAGGMLPLSTITTTLIDTGVPTTKTLTATAYLNEPEWQWRFGDFVVANVRGIMNTIESVT